MSKHQLSKRQEAIFSFIVSYSEEHGYPPSVREIGTAVGLASPSTVHMHLKVLEDCGMIRRNSKKPRTIEVVREELDKHRHLASVSIFPNDGVISLPLIGHVAAGTPILAEENVEDRFSLPTSIVGDSASFVLKVQGLSMIKAGINDGDFISVREQNDAQNGEIVVALIEDSATVKTFYREDGRIRLQPENDMMAPIFCNENEVTILGKVTGVFRRIK